MYTVYVGIGNSDDRLSQAQWSQFWHMVDGIMRAKRSRPHFIGSSLPSSPYQNAMWVVEVDDPVKVSWLRGELDRARIMYDQDSIAWLCVRSDQLEFIQGGDSGTA